MTDRYFIDEPVSTGRVVLAGPEAHHLIHVMRAARGTQVVLFDGSGAEFPAVVQEVGRNSVELSVSSREVVDRELPLELTLGVPLPKGDRQKWLIEKAVELGVTRIVPLRTQRAVAQPVEQALARLRRTVIEASKQCGRNRLLQIDAPRNWPDFVAEAADVPCRLLAHPHCRLSLRESSGESALLSQTRGAMPTLAVGMSEMREDRHMPTASVGMAPVPAAFGHKNSVEGDLPDRVLMAVGPEGGFTDDEVALAVAAGWEIIGLGPRILRVETAALLLAAIVVHHFVHA
jgi:16S rRNA (uracil1498-N3)-methyltransferase